MLRQTKRLSNTWRNWILLRSTCFRSLSDEVSVYFPGSPGTAKANYFNGSHSSTFASSNPTDASSLAAQGKLSRDVVKAMAQEAVVQNDPISLNLLAGQALQAQDTSSVEEIVKGYQMMQSYSSIGKLFEQCSRYGIVMNPEVCKEMAAVCVFNAKWLESYKVVAYMIRNKMECSERLLFYTISGLMMDHSGLPMALQLVKLIVVNRREDLAKFISLSKVSSCVSV